MSSKTRNLLESVMSHRRYIMSGNLGFGKISIGQRRSNFVMVSHRQQPTLTRPIAFNNIMHCQSNILSSTELTTPATTSTQNVINISRRSFAAPSRRGNNNNKGNGGNSSEPLSNESLIKTLIKNAGAATADDVTVRLVIDEGAGQPSTVDIMKLTQAIQVSVDRGIDLVGASIDNVDPPVVRAIDLAKLQFQRQHALKKRQQENSSSSGGNKEKKSFRFRSGIDDHDLERKLSQMISFLQKGHDCDYSVFTKARSMRENTAAGSELVERIQALLADHAVLKKDPEMNETGSFYKVMLRPKKS